MPCLTFLLIIHDNSPQDLQPGSKHVKIGRHGHQTQDLMGLRFVLSQIFVMIPTPTITWVCSSHWTPTCSWLMLWVEVGSGRLEPQTRKTVGRKLSFSILLVRGYGPEPSISRVWGSICVFVKKVSMLLSSDVQEELSSVSKS